MNKTKRPKRPKIKHWMLSGCSKSHYDYGHQTPDPTHHKVVGMSRKLYHCCFPDLIIRGAQRAIGDTAKQGALRTGLFDRTPRRFKQPVVFNSGMQLLYRYTPV